MFYLTNCGWKEHSSLTPPPEILESDYKLWTGEGSVLYLIKYQDETAGFARLGSRGCDPDWLEDIFVKNEFKNLGIGSKAILLLEEEVRKYSVSMYIEVSASNYSALNLYRRLGFDVLSSVTVRKDFNPEDFNDIAQEKIGTNDFTVRKLK